MICAHYGWLSIPWNAFETDSKILVKCRENASSNACKYTCKMSKNHTKEPLKCQENACKMSMTIPAKMLAKCL